MKHTSIRNKTHVIALATGLLFAPLAGAQTYDKKNSQRHSPSSQQMESGQQAINIAGTQMSIDDLVGTTVVNRQDETLGEIEDIVYGSSGNQATHVVVSTDDWFDGRTALIPISSLEQAGERTRDNYFENLMGGIIVLDMDEERFESIASFKRGNDLEEYLDEQASEIADALDLEENDIFDENQRYQTALTNRSREQNDRERQNRDSRDQSYASNEQDSDAQAWRNEDEQQYRYSGDSVNWESRQIQLDSRSIEASEIQGVEVVNNDDARLGKVVDIIVNDSRDATNYLVVRTDDWFDGDHAIVPAQSLKYHEDTQDPHPDDGAHWWMGDHVVLDMSEETFEELADYRRDEDPNTYIRDNRDRIRDTYSLRYSAIPVAGPYYTFAYSVPYTAASYDDTDASQDRRQQANREQNQNRDRSQQADRAQERGSDRYQHANSQQNRPHKDQMVSVGDQRIELSELKGKKVKAQNGKKVATVADAVADAESGNIEFLVLKSSRGDKHAIVPLSSIESSSKERDHDHKGNACATWDGRSLTLSADAAEFQSWASFESSEEFDSFLDRAADQISDAFGIDEDDINDPNKDYVFVFEPQGYQTASR